MPDDAQMQQAEPEQADASSKLSLSEKLALFNQLSQPFMPKAPGGPEGNNGSADASERRRQRAARYRTQPITVDEVNLVSVCTRALSCAPSIYYGYHCCNYKVIMKFWSISL